MSNFEATVIARLLELQVGYVVDLFNGRLSIRTLENGRYELSTRESHEEFGDALAATRRFVDLRRELMLGFDFEVEPRGDAFRRPGPDEWRVTLETRDPRVRALSVITGVDQIDPDDDNLDVTIELANGAVHHRTFMTPFNAANLLQRWSCTGEHGSGAALVVPDLVLVPKLTADAIVRATISLLDDKALN